MRAGLTLLPIKGARRKAFISAVIAGFIICNLMAAKTACADAITDQLRTQIDRMISVLTDPALKPVEQKKERKKRLMSIAGEIMDFSAIAQRALGKYWYDRTPEEKRNFASLFGDVLMGAYLNRVDTYINDIDDFSSKNIRYTGENRRGQQAVVTTTIISNGKDDFQIAYLLAESKGRWLIVDIAIEGVSIVRNYYAQFQEILSLKSYRDLVAALEAKQH